MVDGRGSAWAWVRQGRPGSDPCAHAIEVFIYEGATKAP